MNIFEQLYNTVLTEKKSETIAVDLDGTLAKYTTWKGATHIGNPVPKMVERIQKWLKNGKTVVIFTARANNSKSIQAIKDWLKKNNLPNLKITNIKTPDISEFWDDRAVSIEKNTGEITTVEEGVSDLIMASLLGLSPLANTKEPIQKPAIQSIETSQQQQTINDIAKTLWGEARGESEKGMRAVATVIYNRAKGNTAKFSKVVKAPKQFSIWNAGEPKVKIRTQTDQKLWDLCNQIAKEMVSGQFTPMGNWDHYFNPKKANPSWGRTSNYTTIGNHRFLYLKNFPRV